MNDAKRWKDIFPHDRDDFQRKKEWDFHFVADAHKWNFDFTPHGSPQTVELSMFPQWSQSSCRANNTFSHSTKQQKIHILTSNGVCHQVRLHRNLITLMIRFLQNCFMILSCTKNCLAQRTDSNKLFKFQGHF